MKNSIKRFEEFNSAIWASTEEELTKYFKCDSCNALYHKFNDIDNKCKFCNSDKIKQISSSEYLFLLKKRLEEDEFKIELDLKRYRETKLVDLISSGINKEKRKIRRNIN